MNAISTRHRGEVRRHISNKEQFTSKINMVKPDITHWLLGLVIGLLN